MFPVSLSEDGDDHCRIGSLETLKKDVLVLAWGSLPHRQLRKFVCQHFFKIFRSLPHRQLRKGTWSKKILLIRSLPHRQLRNAVA